MKKVACLLAGVSFWLSSCGYQWGGHSLLSPDQRLCVPYARGDDYGFLTECVVRELGTEGIPAYTHCPSRYRLNICILEPHEAVIGYRRDRKGEKGESERRVIPTEKRVAIAAQVEVEDCARQCTLLGPVLIQASVDYDFDLYSNHSNVNIFSLGQLNDSDVSRDVVIKPLYRELAHQIVNFVAHAW